MLIVMDMENGEAIRDPVVPEAESRVLPPAATVPLAQLFPQPRLQEVGESLGGLPAALPGFHRRTSLRA
jgi:hypothetical protein